MATFLATPFTFLTRLTSLGHGHNFPFILSLSFSYSRSLGKLLFSCQRNYYIGFTETGLSMAHLPPALSIQKQLEGEGDTS